jgi:hypothetical protein
MIPVETVPGRRMMEGVNLNIIYLIHFKNFVNATMYLHPAQQLKKGDVQERA